MIYLDNSATTKPYPEVLETFQKTAAHYFANPSSIHSKGNEVERLLLQARKLISEMLYVSPQEILFTSGGTEGNNLAIKGIALKHQSRGKHIITTSVEHPSTYESFLQLESLGFDVTYLPVDTKGRVSIEELEKALQDDTILVSVLHVNNETGTIQPVEEIGRFLKNYPKIFFHVDYVQGAAKVPLNIKGANIDLCTISGHKVHGLKGTGILYIREGVSLSPLFTGGEQEFNKRAGTENVPGIASLAKALRLSFERSKDGREHLQSLKELLFHELSNIEGIVINTPMDVSAPHILNFSVLETKPEVLIHALEEENIYISTKSACSSKEVGASRVLLAMGMSEERAASALRVSMSFETTREEIMIFIKTLKEVVIQLRLVMKGAR
ncbi:cysteine desulfurase family protein [Bacillus taeanensis]|uniref:Cysteine desulfurase NifS n=1 Tax=Bacillus taeanensis TaxID=273032 RepID=A0A366XZU3_9BACI|nr:cysteine desulfurase family protein [Bacillus taeanensis]RBW71457.1 cysteine desulfurase NifS [Bacillus taeanensis]